MKQNKLRLLSREEQLEAFQFEIDKKNKEFYDSSSEENKKKLDAIKDSLLSLEKTGLPAMFIVETPFPEGDFFGIHHNWLRQTGGFFNFEEANMKKKHEIFVKTVSAFIFYISNHIGANDEEGDINYRMLIPFLKYVMDESKKMKNEKN